MIAEEARVLGSTGLIGDGVDAVGVRLAAATKGGVALGSAYDVILNLTSGELSYFASFGGGIGLGGSVITVYGNALYKDMPQNSMYRGRGDSLGAGVVIPLPSGLAIPIPVGGYIEYFKCRSPRDSSFITRELVPSLISAELGSSSVASGPRGVFAGLGVVTGLGGSQSVSVAYEMRRTDRNGRVAVPFWQQVEALSVE